MNGTYNSFFLWETLSGACNTHNVVEYTLNSTEPYDIYLQSILTLMISLRSLLHPEGGIRPVSSAHAALRTTEFAISPARLTMTHRNK